VTRVAVERLPGVLGHELRNPLASALTGASLAREMVDADDPRAAVLDGVLADLHRLAELTDGWLDAARAGRCRGASIDVADLVRTVASRHGADVVACPEGLEVAGNRAMLERALDNLGENARRAGASCIRIAVQELPECVAIHVEDDGPGVAPADARRVFTAGWSKSGGTGLGLHAVAATLAAHRGEVRCVPLARGTRFSLTLPRSGAQVARA
jgi:signal transduction histidine kinase